MKNKNVKTKSFFLLIYVIIFSSSLWAQNKYRPGSVIVKLKKTVTQNKAALFLGKATTEKQMQLSRSWSKMKMYHFQLQKIQTVEQAISDLNKDPNVEYAEPDFYLNKASVDGVFEPLSYEAMMEISAQEKVYTSEVLSTQFDQIYQSVSAQEVQNTITVAVIDTGLDMDHPVFLNSNAIWSNPGEVPGNGIDDDGNGYVDDVNGWNFVDNNGVIYDDDDHGTHVSGIVVSAGVDIFSNQIGVSPIKIMPLKFLNASGIGSTSDAINAIYYAVDNGAQVLNNSWGGNSYSQALHEAVAYTYTNGKTFIAAAGNASSNNDTAPMYPASFDVPHVQAIAATTSSDYLASFSNFGYNTVDIGSPGVFIKSTINGGGFGYMSGTSMAAPYVSGVSALMLYYAPTMKGHQVKEIVESASDFASPLSGLVSKESRLNATKAINIAQGAVIEETQPSYNVSQGMSRDLASDDAGGGCGLVTKLHSDFNHNNKNGGQTLKNKSLGQIFTILFILSLPFGITLYLRKRDPVNRRVHERFEFHSDVTMKLGDKEIKGEVSSISLGGVKVDTNALLENGGIMSMKIMSPDGKEMIEVSGQVVWAEDGKSYGVKFSEVTSTTLNQISNWTEALQKT